VSATLKIRVIPRAKKTEWGGKRGDALVVRLQAPPVEGAANEALIKFLAKEFGVRAGDVQIVSGERARDKVVRVEGREEGELQDRLKHEMGGAG
jgi:uncharacterized protein (TIGR00251 family)